MLTYIEEFRTHLVITGFRGTRIKKIEDFLKVINREEPPSVEAQFFDAKLVATWQHLYFAVLNALTAFENKQNLSKNLAMETMLYASAQGQISKATKIMGIKPESEEIAAIVIGKKKKDVDLALSLVTARVNAKQDDKVLELSKQKVEIIRKAFAISDVEINTVVRRSAFEKALVDLVIERMALLATRK